MQEVKEAVLSLLKELKEDMFVLQSLKFFPPSVVDSPFYYEDAYDRFLGKVLNAPGVFERPSNWQSLKRDGVQ